MTPNQIAEKCAEAWFSPVDKLAEQFLSDEDRRQARSEFVEKILPTITEALEEKENELASARAAASERERKLCEELDTQRSLLALAAASSAANQKP